MLRVDLAQDGDGLFGETIGEVFAVIACADVLEGKDTDAKLLRVLCGAMDEGADLGDEAIAAAGDGGDEAVFSAIFAENAAQGGDVLIEIILFNDGVGPNGFEKFFLGEDLTATADEEKEGVEDLGVSGICSPTRESISFPVSRRYSANS